MAKTTVFVCTILVCMILEVDMSKGSQLPSAYDSKIDCAGKCSYRCSKASRHKMCIRACNTCCERCNCVPAGTSGNRDVCPCYAHMKTHNGRLKCP